jgi:hypothetical protein
MRTGTDRSQPGYPGGTRHPCPFCDWYLDAPPISDLIVHSGPQSIMDLISRRLAAINDEVQQHMANEHPQEFNEATQLRVDITG